MPLIVKEYQPTPNPHALKCVLDRAIPPLASDSGIGMRSYATRESAVNDPIASALFDVPGVRNVLINETGWISVGKDPSATWESVKAGVERALVQAV